MSESTQNTSVPRSLTAAKDQSIVLLPETFRIGLPAEQPEELPLKLAVSKPPNGPHIRCLGHILHMHLPAGWVDTTVEASNYTFVNHPVHYREFERSDSGEVTFSYWNRAYLGYRLRIKTGRMLMEILRRPLHRLKKEERMVLDEVIGSAETKKDHRILDLHTAELNGKRVLVLEGRWKETGDRSSVVFVPSDRDGRLLEQIYYEAPAEKYRKYLPEIQQTFDSINWVEC